MDLFFCIIQGYSTSYHSENKLKPTSTKMKSNGPSGSLKSPVLFLCPWKQSHNLYRLNLGLHERKALPVRVQDITPMPLYLNDIPLVTPHFGVQNSSTAWVVSCSDTEAPMGSVLSLAHSQLGDSPDVPQGFCSAQTPHNNFLNSKLLS